MKFSQLINESYFVNKDKIKTLLGEEYFKDLNTEIKGILFRNTNIKDSNNKFLWLLLNIYAHEQKSNPDNYQTSFDHIIYTPEDLLDYIKAFEDKGTKLDFKGINSFEKLRILLETSFKISKKDIKKGLGSFRENKDYIKIPNLSIKAIIPLNHKVSKYLGSIYFGGIQGKWCTSKNESIQWNKHVKEKKEILVIILFNKTKLALQFDKNGNFLEIFNQTDNPIRHLNEHINIPNLDKIKFYIKKNLKQIQNSFPKQ